MKRISVIIFISLVSLCWMPSLAQNYRIALHNGNSMNIEVCTDGIFRIQISPRGTFEESLMIRYGVVKADWGYQGATFQDTDRTAVVSTPSYALSVDKNTGVVTLVNPDGNIIVGGITLLGSKDTTVRELAAVINDKFASLNVSSNGGIIGDDNGTVSEKDKQESGDPDKSSIISIVLREDDYLYGGGSTSREHIQHRGELLRMWATYQRTEIPMPFMMSSNGWGIYNNSTRKNYFDVGSFDKERLLIYNTYDEADFYLMAGDGMPAILDAYTQVTGRPYVLPKWAYGLCFGPNMNEDQWDILNDAVLFRQTQVPCDLFWLEPQWMGKRYDFSTKKTWNYDKFSPEPYWRKNTYPKQLYHRLFIGKLRSMGFHLGLWLCEEYDLSLVEEDAIAAREGRALSGEEHWMDHLTTFLDYGVEGFKLDPARTIDEHTFWNYYNGKTDKVMHNLNQVLLPKQLAEMTRNHTGKRTWHHYCGGWSGAQHWAASTSGDNGGGKTALYDQLNLGMSGFLNTSCDVMAVEREQEMQSLHFGLFLPWVQINSWFSMMHPFYYDAREQGMYRDYVKLRYSLLPYIYSMALESTQNGMPMVRSMPLVFSDDHNVVDMTYQYMFGNSFLLGIFTNEIYLPAGQWTDYWTGERIVSKGETITHSYPDNRSGLLFVRDGSIIPMQPDVQYVGTKPWDTLILHVFPSEQSEYTLYEDDGESYAYEDGAISSTTFRCTQSKGMLTFVIDSVRGSFDGQPSSRTYQLCLHMDSKPKKVAVNGSAVKDWQYADGLLTVMLGDFSMADQVVVTVK